MEADGSLLEKLIEDICHRPLSSTIPAHMTSCEESFKAAPQLKKTANQLLNGVFRCRQRTSATHLLNLLNVFLHADDGFCNAFIERLIARANTFYFSFGSARLLIVRMICCILNYIQDMNTPIVKDIVQIHCSMLEYAGNDNKRLFHGMTTATITLLKKSTAIFQLYFDILCTTTTISDKDALKTRFQLARIMIPSFVSSFSVDQRTRLLSSYTFWSLESKYRPDVNDLDSYKIFLETINDEEFSTVVEPVLSKMLKKSPDSILSAVQNLVHHLRIDLSRLVESIFISIFTAKLRSQKEDVRENSISLVLGVVKRCVSIEPIEKIVVELLNVLEGKHGILAQFYQREAVFLAFDGIYQSIVQSEHENISNLALLSVSRLVKAIAKEANESTRNLGLSTLTKWIIVLNPATLPADIASMFLSGLQNKAENIVNAHARALLLLTDDLHAIIDPKITKELIRIVETSNKKPNVLHLDGVLAMNILAALSVKDEGFKTTCDVASLLLDPASFYAPSVAILSQTSLSVQVIDSIEITALKYIPATILSVMNEQTTDSILIQQLVSVLNHSNVSVRSNAQDKIQSFLVENPWISKSLLVAFSTSILTVQNISTSIAAATEDGPSEASRWTSLAGIFRKNLRNILPQEIYEEELIVQVLPKTLILAHHPLLVSGKSQESFCREWDSLKHRFVSTIEEDFTIHDAVDDLIEFIPNLKSAIVNEIKLNLYSPIEENRISVHRSIATLLDFAGNGAGEGIILHEILKNELSSALASQELLNLSQQDIEIFYTPENELYELKKTSQENNQQLKIHGTADERWEQQIRDEINRKKNLNGNQIEKKKYTKEQIELLKNQNIIRQNIQQKIIKLNYIFNFFNFLSITMAEEIQPALPYLIQPILGLLKTELFSEMAYSILKSITKSITPSQLQSHSNLIASSLRLAYLANFDENPTAKLNQSKALFERLFHVLSETVFGFILETENDFELDSEYALLTPPTYHVIYPILNVLIEKSNLFKPIVLPLFAVHGKMISVEEEMEVGDMAAQRLLRRSMIQVCLSWLEREEREGMISPSEILARICTGPSLDLNEWEPFCSDSGLLSGKTSTRLACLNAILRMTECIDIERNLKFISLIFLGCFDADEKNRKLSGEIWSKLSIQLPQDFDIPLIQLLSHQKKCIREYSASALANGMKIFPELMDGIILKLKNQFYSNKPQDITLNQFDSFGIPIIRRHNEILVEGPETILPRMGVGICLESCAREGIFPKEIVMDVIFFIIKDGLSDNNADVRVHMRKAGVQVLEKYGAQYTAGLLSILETPLETSKQDMEAHDHQKEGIVVFLGSLAKHMEKTDPKVASIVTRLIDGLNIPAESVQRAIANCLAPLIPAVKDQSTSLLNGLMEKATNGETFGDRIGAAYGVSAVVKGLGIAALKQHTIIPRLEEAMKSSNPNSRQGSLMVIECLCERLGFLFEPYVIVILPILLKSFADSNAYVREAAARTSKGIMRHLSAHGVKLVLPSILRAVDDSAWRTKQAAIQLLGTMASCAPKQLGSCLPQIIPKLIESISDSHPRVKEAGHTAMNDIAHVIRNPEVSSIASILLGGLQDPNRKTNDALQALQSMVFVHSIDAPSMALIMPILQHGLTDRLSDTKKKAALIVGNMCSMVNESKDLVPYLDTISPCLQAQLLDPIPEVRSVASKSLGMLVKGLGQTHFPTLVVSLLNAMKADTSSVERSGSAQGLCEVLVALGIDFLDTNLRQEIFPIARHPKSSVREGVLWTIAFLPPALGKSFAKYLTIALPIIVAGLSDEAEGVREVAMHAGSIVVNAHALSHTKDILPSLEAGIFDDNWRIRQSSISLLGDMLYRISGTTIHKIAQVADGDSDDEEDSLYTAAGEKSILKLLGKTRRDQVLASLYMIRSDTSAVVRQSALQVWKTIVSNTPKTLKSILETLMNSIVQALSGNNPEKQSVAGRSLGEIVRKLGERVMPEVVPILRSGLSPHNPEGMRQGVCLGLAEVIGCSPKKQLEDYVDTLVQALEEALCDPILQVRMAAGHAFDVFHKSMGYRSIDEVIPRLLKRVQSSDDEERQRALSGLQELLKVKSREVLPYLIPRLLTTPLTIAHVQAIAHVSTVCGSVIHYHIDRIMAVLFNEYVSFKENEKMTTAIKESLKEVVLAVETPGVQWLSSEMCKYCESDIMETRYLACWLVSAFCRGTHTDYDEQVPIFIRYILQRFNDIEPSVVIAALDSFNSLNATIRPEEFAKHIDFIRNNLNSLVSDARHRKGGVGFGEFLLPALTLPKGIDPFLPAYQFALMNGTPEARQSAATGLGELVLLSNTLCLKSVLIKITGPLIRIAGDRFPSHVKGAILSTLEILLLKGGVALKPFLPQLQTTFVKALNDTSNEVRQRGGSALAELVKLSPRVDPLVTELIDKVGSTSSGVKEANLTAILAILNAAGAKVSQSVLETLFDSLVVELSSEEDVIRTCASDCLSQVFGLLPEEGESRLATVVFNIDASSPWTTRHSAALISQNIVGLDAQWIDACVPRIADQLVLFSQDEKVNVRNAALNAMSLVVKRNPSSIPTFLTSVTKSLQDDSKDVIRSALRVVKKFAKHQPSIVRPHLNQLIPQVFQLIKTPNVSIKFGAERALLYLLEIHSRPETLADYTSTAEQGKLLAEYARRVLSKLKVDSDSDDE